MTAPAASRPPTGRPPLPVLALALLLIASAGCHATTSAPARTANPAPRTTADSQGWVEQFARGYFPGRSGQVFLVPREGDFVVDRNPLYAFMHGSPWSYDTHVPLLFHGAPFVTQGVFNDRVTQQDVVPTLATLLGTAPPATTTGRALQQAIGSTTARPKIVALFVLDGVRADYLDTYADAIPTLTKLRREGAYFSNAHVTSVPTLTAVGHANLGSGTEPRIHGLVVNNLFNRITGKPQEAYNQLDPGEMMALTLADVWNIETEGRAVIIGQGGAIRATAGLVGHGACLLNGHKVFAASYTTRDAGWETNPTCYAMSDALKPLNGRKYWEEAGGKWMGHDISDATKFRHSAVFQRFEGDALAAVLEHEAVGADAITDLVLVNFKGPDYVGHAYGPSSPEIKAELGEMDRQLARALGIIARKSGGSFVSLFTADHGMPGEPRPGGRHYMDEISALIDKRFSPSGGTVVQYYNDAANNQIHLDTTKLASLGVSLKDVAAFLKTQDFFAAVYTEEEVRAAQSRLRLRD